MPEIVKKVRLRDLDGQRVVDRDGVEVRVPAKPAPTAPAVAKEAAPVNSNADLVDAMRAGQAIAAAQLQTMVEIQREIAKSLAMPKPKPQQLKRVSIKVRREANLIVDMVATPEY